MLPQDSGERVKIDLERAKHWLSMGRPAQRSGECVPRQGGLTTLPERREQTNQHLPKTKAQERAKARCRGGRGRRSTGG